MHQLPLCGQRENCNTCCDQQSPLLSPAETKVVIDSLQMEDVDMVRRIFRNTLKRLQKRGIDPGKLYSQLEDENDLFSKKMVAMAHKYFEDNPLKNLKVGMEKNENMLAHTISLIIKAIGYLDAGKDPEAALRKFFAENPNDELAKVAFIREGEKRARPDPDKLAEMGGYLAKWIYQRTVVQGGRRTPMEELRTMKPDEIMFFIQMINESGNIKDPCPAINKETGRCDIYSARPRLCSVVGGEYAPARPEIAGCGANLKHCINHSLMFRDANQAVRELNDNSLFSANKGEVTITSLDFVFLVSCGRILQGGTHTAMRTQDLMAL